MTKENLENKINLNINPRIIKNENEIEDDFKLFRISYNKLEKIKYMLFKFILL